MGHLDEEGVARFVEEGLSAEARAEVLRHVDGCARCRARLAAAVQATLPSETSRDQTQDDGRRAGYERAWMLPSGTRVGRYQILEALGSGGMGVVYAAHDPELDRKIALKLLRTDLGEHAEAQRARLVREAQAMARITHPNVITVHDVGTVDGQVFVAMELVEGHTLHDWCHLGQRGWREVLAVMVPAGRGLAAAHAAGLVHRDFKPDNVLLGAAGRVRVTDFGLARALAATSLPLPLSAGVAAVDPSLDVTLTRDGAVVGTPAYMAPEQMRGEVADERSDQFSFCVTLFEALCGERPFDGRTIPELQEAIVAGRVRPPRPPAATTPARARDLPPVPLWLRRALVRGLDADPARRWPSMEALLAALERTSRLTSRRVAAAALVLALAATGVTWRHGATQSRRCREAGRKLDGVWDARRKREVRERLDGGDGGTWPQVEAALDRYAHAWVAQHTDACEATHVHGEQSEALLDLRMECLDQRRSELAALTGLLASDATLRGRAVQATQALVPLDRCRNVEALRATVRPRAPRGSLDRVRATLARATAYALAFVPAATRRDAHAAAQQAAELGALDLQAEALTLAARADEMEGELDGAAAGLHEAAVLGALAHDDVAVARALTLLGSIETSRGDFVAAERWVAVAASVIERAGGDARLGADRLLVQAFLEWRRDRNGEAVARAQAALARLATLPERDGAAEARALGLYAAILGDQGRFEEAAALYRRARAFYAETLGEAHPRTVSLDESIAVDELEQGHVQTALEAEREVLARTKPEAVSELAVSETNFGFMLIEAGRAAEALPHMLAAVRAAESVDGSDDEIAFARSGLGCAYVALGKPAPALPPLEHALKLQTGEGQRGDRAVTELALARALWDAGGDRERALTLARAAGGYLRAHPLGARRRRQLERLDRWLAERGPR